MDRGSAGWILPYCRYPILQQSLYHEQVCRLWSFLCHLLSFFVNVHIHSTHTSTLVLIRRNCVANLPLPELAHFVAGALTCIGHGAVVGGGRFGWLRDWLERGWGWGWMERRWKGMSGCGGLFGGVRNWVKKRIELCVAKGWNNRMRCFGSWCIGRYILTYWKVRKMEIWPRCL